MDNNIGIKPFTLYLPNKSIDLSKWAVVACDQFTSEPNYWKNVSKYVGLAKSTLNIIHPEAFLDDLDLQSLKKTMDDYLSNGTIEKKSNDCFVLIERTINGKKRIGLIVTIDLEHYGFTDNEGVNIISTEEVIFERLNTRIDIREISSIEVSHTIVFLNDPKKTTIETIYNKRDSNPIFDFNLMDNGGNIKGWIIQSQNDLDFIDRNLNKLMKEHDDYLLLVGDGNHSLAAAKAYWNKIKNNLSEKEIETNPYRYYMVELVNLFSDAVVFEPIHRVIYEIEKNNFIDALSKYLETKGKKLIPGEDFAIANGKERDCYSILGCEKSDLLLVIQSFLDNQIENNNYEVDYIHGDENLERLLSNKKAVGLFLKPMNKKMFLNHIKRFGVLPKKAFSIGNPNEKRYYLECRVLKNI